MRSTLIMLGLLCLPLCAAAQDAPKQTLSAIQSDTALLKAQAANNAAKRLAQGLPAEAAATGAGTPAAGPGAQPLPLADVPSDAPVVLGVFGPSGHTYARIRMPDGTTVSATPGLLPGGRWRLLDLTGGVRLVRVRSK